jgi:hypothetical protein
MHRKRLLVAAIFLPVIYLYIMYLPAGYFSLLLTAITFVALAEFYTMPLSLLAIGWCLVQSLVISQ